MKPACMTDEEWATWNRPFVVYQEADGERLNIMRPPRGYPCFDCPREFAAEQKAQGTCDGTPNPAGRRRLAYPAEVAVARRRQQWREYHRRRRAAGAA